MREDPSFMLTVLLVVIVIVLIPYIFYLLTLQKALSRVSEPNREMTPGLVWLNLVPIFSLGWQIYTVIKISNSLRKEYAKRNIQEQGSFGYGIGLAFSILAIVSIIPYIGTVAGLAALVCWIIYWVQIAGYSRKIA